MGNCCNAAGADLQSGTPYYKTCVLNLTNALPPHTARTMTTESIGDLTSKGFDHMKPFTTRTIQTLLNMGNISLNIWQRDTLLFKGGDSNRVTSIYYDLVDMIIIIINLGNNDSLQLLEFLASSELDKLSGTTYQPGEVHILVVGLEEALPQSE